MMYNIMELITLSLLILLQLKLYAESPSSSRKIKITDSYYAQACDETILISTIEGSSRRLLIITICTSIATTVVTTLIVVTMGTLIGCTNSCSFKHSKFINKLERRSPVIFALTVVSIFANAYMFCMSWTAMSTWEQHHVSSLISSLVDLDEINYINRSSIGFLVVFNTISMICSIIVIGIVAALLCFYSSKSADEEKLQKIRFLRLVSVLCACLSICAHLPYIAIAYLNNEHHATGIFIYYSLLGCLLFGLSWIIFHYYYQYNSKSDKKDKHTCCRPPTQVYQHKLSMIVALSFIICLTLIFFIILTCFFLLIPINKSISEFPNRIVGIYMSGGFVISAFFLYKLLVYLCRKTKHHQSDSTPTDEFEDMLRERSESDWKCAEHNTLKRIEEKVQNIGTSMQKFNNKVRDSASPTTTSGEN